MRLHDFDLNLLVYLDALLNEKSVSKAAARVNITQPAMSEALARLRDYFKDDLLISVAGRNMILSPLGHSLLEPVREILLRMQSVTSAAAEFDAAKSDRCFTIMTSDYVFDVFLRTALAHTYTVAPGIRIEIRRLAPDSEEQIKRPDIDLLIASDSRISHDLPSEPLFKDPITCVVWSRNQFVGDELSVDQFMSMGHVCAATDDGVGADYEDAFASGFGSRGKVEVIAQDFGMVVRAVQGTDRIGTVPSLLARMYEAEFSLRLIKPPVSFPPVVEYLQWHRQQEHDPGLLWLRSLLKSLGSKISPA